MDSLKEKQRRHQAAYEQRMKDKGLVQVRVWVVKGKAHLVRDYAKELNSKEGK